MNEKEFATWLGQIDGVQVHKFDENRVFFSLGNEKLITKITAIADLSDNFLSIHMEKEGIVFCLHKHKYDKFVEIYENKNNKNSKYGIPDLSLVTVKQMMNELKNRQNISFVFIMTENLNVSNITLEASGNPTYICGLLSRGLHLANKFAEKDITYTENEGE